MCYSCNKCCSGVTLPETHYCTYLIPPTKSRSNYKKIEQNRRTRWIGFFCPTGEFEDMEKKTFLKMNSYKNVGKEKINCRYRLQIVKHYVRPAQKIVRVSLFSGYPLNYQHCPLCLSTSSICTQTTHTSNSPRILH